MCSSVAKMSLFSCVARYIVSAIGDPAMFRLECKINTSQFIANGAHLTVIPQNLARINIETNNADVILAGGIQPDNQSRQLWCDIEDSFPMCGITALHYTNYHTISGGSSRHDSSKFSTLYQMVPNHRKTHPSW